mmetsp:Transcript_25264/g.35964  ORF Transcript_25264/g.35964 Transcript_25264/m.35964 type:complete len:243 (+) Transcript_25264:34-762(+)
MVAQNNVLNFSAGLLQTLATSRAKVDSYIMEQKAEIDRKAAWHQESLAKEQDDIIEATMDLKAVQSKRGLSDEVNEDSPSVGMAQQRESLKDQKEELCAKADLLQATLDKQEEKVKELKELERYHQAKAEEVRDLKRRVEQAKTMTVEDLTRGIINYSYLGLDFQSATNGRLKFAFTQLDAGDWNRPFSFTLSVTDEDLYEVHDCEPRLAASILTKLATEFNENDDLGRFILEMRKAFSTVV